MELKELTLDGITRSIKDWAKITKISKTTIVARIARGISIEKALTTPTKKTNPYKKVGDREYKVKKTNLEKRMTDSERDMFLLAFTKDNFGKWADRNKGICIFLLNTGLRLGELCQLKTYDVLNENRSYKEYLDVRAEIAKRKKSRQIPLNDRAREALSLLIKETNSMNDNIVILSCRQIREIINQVSIRSGLNRLLTPHCLRHDFLSRIYSKTKDVKITQRLAGHSSSSTTMDCYVDSTWNDLEDAVNKI